MLISSSSGEQEQAACSELTAVVAARNGTGGEERQAPALGSTGTGARLLVPLLPPLPPPHIAC